MKNKIQFLIILVIFVMLSSCNNKVKLIYSDSDHFTVEDSVSTLEKNGWYIEESTLSNEELTTYMINYMRYTDEEFDMGPILDCIDIIGPDRLQTNPNTIYSVSFMVFSSEKDALNVYNIYLESIKATDVGIYFALNKNVLVETNSTEAVELILLEFVRV